MSYFNTLNTINVGEHTEKKNGLTYLSWAWAWAELKKKYPNSYYTIYENANGWFYHTDGQTAWVKTGVTVVDEDNQVEHIEYLPVMDFRNKSIPVGNVTSFDVNKAIQRSLTKAVARHGLGLYIYAGEDLPEDPKFEELKAEISNLLHVPVEDMSSQEKQKLVEKMCKLKGKSVNSMCAWAGVESVADMSNEKLDELMTILSK